MRVAESAIPDLDCLPEQEGSQDTMQHVIHPNFISLIAASLFRLLSTVQD